MAITKAYEGSATVTTTEFSLVNGSTTTASGTTAGIYQAFLGLGALDDATVLAFKIRNVLSENALATVHYETIAHAQGNAPNYAAPALVLGPGFDLSLTLSTGSATLVQYEIWQVA